ncbi:hypothetical protein TEA_009916 [Camellia sinensis var. sinensis]|uniref:Uncharacterized protein n=1 Tax=Camellia sinensis var. sinensis TaxID=542762 RepID=A0A4S4DGK6_CAMSN|nr:hypothetical protein TEA_009916 [Camellia sinensis var. sinensis]
MSSQSIYVIPAIDRWRLALAGHLKINCDAAYYKHSLMESIVVVVCDSHGKLVEGRTQSVLAPSTLQEEAYAIQLACLVSQGLYRSQWKLKVIINRILVNFSSMETKKDKHLLEKSSSFAFGDAEQDNHDREHDQQDPDRNPKLNPNKDHHQNNATNNSELPTEIEPKQESNKAENKYEFTTQNIEESPPPPPDFGKVSEEIDHFIHAVSNIKDQESDLPKVPDAVEQFAFLAKEKIANYDSIESPVKWNQLSKEDTLSFLDRLLKVTALLTVFSSELKYASSNWVSIQSQL